MHKDCRRLANLATNLIGTDKSKAGIAFLKRVVDETQDVSAKINLAIAYTNIGEYVVASKILSKLVQDSPNDILVWHAYGVLSMVAGLPADAINCFQNCIKLDPTNGTLEFDLSLALLQSGLWEKGFEAYESRRDFNPEKSFPGLPKWDGSEGKSVYVWCEQGLGDSFQFSRYIPWLATEKKCKVTFACPENTHAVFVGFSKYAKIVHLVKDVSGIDCEVPLMSLAHHYGTTQGNVPEDPGLIGSTIEAAEVFTDKFKVGLCWGCNPKSVHHRERSLPFQDLLQVVENSDCDFFSLQVGDKAADISANAAQMVVKDLSHELEGNWVATVAYIKAMDYIVTTDTSVAHLAAILKKPTITFLARRDWWRWGNEGSTTPWYPTMHIIRQEKPFSWAKEVAKASAIIGAAARGSRLNS